MLKLKLLYFGPLMQRADSLEKTLMLGKIEGGRRGGRRRMRCLDGITDSVDMGLGELRELEMTEQRNLTAAATGWPVCLFYPGSATFVWQFVSVSEHSGSLGPVGMLVQK